MPNKKETEIDDSIIGTFFKKNWLVIILFLIIISIGLNYQFQHKNYIYSKNWETVLFYNPLCGILNAEQVNNMSEDCKHYTTYSYLEIQQRYSKAIDKVIQAKVSPKEGV